MPLQLDFRYPIATVLGISRLVQFVLGIIVLICIGSTWPLTGVSFIYFVATASLITSLVFLVLNVFHLPESGPCGRLPWNLMEFGFLSLWAILYVICGIMTAVWSSRYHGTVGTNLTEAYGAASFFCFAAAVVYGICAYTYFRRWRFHGTTTGSSVTVEQRTATTTSTSRY